MTVNPDYISPCGLYCGVCAIHIAHRDNNQKLKERLASLYRGAVPGKGTLPNSENLSTDGIRCGGCLSRCLFMHCGQYDIRNCTQAKKGYTGCHRVQRLSLRAHRQFFHGRREKSNLACQFPTGANTVPRNGCGTKKPATTAPNAATRFSGELSNAIAVKPN